MHHPENRSKGQVPRARPLSQASRTSVQATFDSYFCERQDASRTGNTTPPRAQQTTASSKAKNGVKNTNQRFKAETSGSNLHISQTHDNPHEQKAQLSEYGKKSAYAQGFQPKQNDSKHKKEDDIISKQLKDAASREKDPNLRKKLWYEYERYKSNL